MSIGIASATLATTLAFCNPSFTTSSSSSLHVNKALEYSYGYNVQKNNILLNKNNNSSSNKELTLKKTIDIYELESNEIIFEINKALNVNIDDIFIPNKTEKNVTLFVTCQEFRELCENEKYQEAYELENRISVEFNNIKGKYTNIGMVAFL